MNYRGYDLAHEPASQSWVGRKNGVAAFMAGSVDELKAMVDQAVDPWVGPGRYEANGGSTT